MSPLEKTRLQNLLCRVIGRPENIPEPPTATGCPAVHKSASPYRCEPDTWGTAARRARMFS